MGKWDLSLKTLVWENPQDFVSLLLAGARYVGRREGQFQKREIRSDGLLEVEYAGEKLLIHVEFQVKKDKHIGERLLDYNYEARRAYKLPVMSCVIYLKRVVKPPQSPLIWDVPGWGESLVFTYLSLELAKTPVEELEEKRLVGLSPLFLLSKGGATREVLDQAITRLLAEKKTESLMMLRLVAAAVFENEDDLAWIEWRFAIMEEFLESSRYYQQITKKAEKEGLEKGLEKGLEQGIRQSIEIMVQTRFPALAALAKERIEHIQDREMLEQVLVAMIAAQTEKKARRYLLALETGK